MNRPSTNYQKQVNKFVQDIASRNPTLLVNRGKLLEQAQHAVFENVYYFKKGYSRSKRYSNSSSKEAAKCPKINKELREKRISDLEEQIKDFQQRISFKEKRVTVAANVHNYKLCDEISGEITDIKGKCRELQQELKLLLEKDKRAKRYKDSVSSKLNDSNSDNEMPPTSSSSAMSGVESSPADESTKSQDIRKFLTTGNQGIEYTAAEVEKFKRRLEESYDLPDDRYDGWLRRFHPNCERFVKIKQAVSNAAIVIPDNITEVSEDAALSHVHPF